MILITGAAGAIGSRVARLLTGRGLWLRLMARDAARPPILADGMAVSGDYANPESLGPAFARIETAFIVSGYAPPGERWRLHANAVDAAIAAGVKRVVYLSFQGASPDSKFSFARDHFQTETYIRASGLPFTFIRPNLYLDHVPHFFGDDGIVRGPAGDGRAAWVRRDDIAAVIAAALTQEGHEDQTYDVTGSESLTLAETAARLSALVGRPLSYEPETLAEAVASRQHFGAPAWEVDAWVSSYEAIAAGELAPISDAVARLTGAPATTLEPFFERDPTMLDRLRKEPII